MSRAVIHARAVPLGAALVLLLAPLAQALDADVSITQLVRKQWTTNDGLPHSSVRDIHEDRVGFIWLATENGIARFDGLRFEVFDTGNTQAMPSDFVFAVIPDGERLWFPLYSGGLVYRDGDTFGSIAELDDEPVTSVLPLGPGSQAVGTSRGLVVLEEGRIAARFGAEDGLPSPEIFSLARDGDDVLIGTSSGLARLHDGGITPVSIAAISDTTIFQVAAADGNRFWIAHDHGVGILEGDSYRAVDLPVSRAGVYEVSRDGDGRLWFATTLGLVRRNRSGDYRVSRLDSKSDILAIHEDRHGNLLVGTLGSGLMALSSPRALSFGKPEGLAGGLAWTVMQAGDGSIWVGTDDAGVQVIERDGRAHPMATDAGALDGSVQSLARGPDGSTWIARRGETVRLRDGRVTSIEPLADEQVRAIWPVAPNEAWFGTDTGLHLIDGTRVTRRIGTDDGLSSARVTVLESDGRGGVYVGTWSGIDRLDPHSGTIDNVASARAILDLHAGSDGTLWAGTFTGLGRLRGTDLELLGARHGLPDQTITAIEEHDGRLWLGTNRGLVAVAKDQAYAVLDGRLARLTPEVIGSEDGMRNVEVSGGFQPSSWPSSDGRLWFPTGSGVVTIAPGRVPPAPSPPRAVVLALRADGREIATQGPARELPAQTRRAVFSFTAPTMSRPGELRFQYRLVGFDDAWIELRDSRRATYTNLPPGRFRFEVRAGYGNGRWGPPTSSVIAVPAQFYQRWWFWALCGLVAVAIGVGLYRLRVRRLLAREAELSDLVDERTRNLKDAQAQLVQAERLASVASLVSGIAHELNNPIGYISGNLVPLRKYTSFLSAVAEKLGDGVARSGKELEDILHYRKGKDLRWVTEDLQKILAEMEEGARRVGLVVGDLQGLTGGRHRSLESVDVSDALERTVRLLRQRLEGVEVASEPGEVPAIEMRAGHLEQVLTNLIDNAARAAREGGGHATLRSRREGEEVVVEVEDDGPGMSPEVREKALEPFFTTRAAGEGSGLGLAIVLSILEEHGGSMTIDSEPGRGTRIEVRLPTRPRGQAEGPGPG